MDKTTKTIIGIIIAVAIIVIGHLVFYRKSTEPAPAEPATTEPVSEEVIKIGAIQPLTGKVSYVGEWVSQGINLAIDEFNKQGKKIEVIYEDDACDPTKAVNAIEKLINIDKVKIIIGPTCSSSVLASAPIAEENKVIIFSTVATALRITDAGDYIFRNRENDSAHGKTMGEFAYNNLNAKKAGILFLNLDNGIGFKDSFKKRFIELGGEVIIEESFNLKETDFRTQLMKIKSANPDVLYFAGQKMENAVVQARELGIDQKILGPSTMQNDTLVEVAGNFAEGLLYSYPDINPNSEQFKSYQAKYKDKYNQNSEAYAANSYDALNIIVAAINKCSGDTDCIKEYFYNTKKYQGVSGVFGFDKNGDVTRRLIIKTVKDGKFVPYKE